MFYSIVILNIRLIYNDDDVILYLPSEKDISSILYMGESNVYNKKYNATLVEIYIYYKVYYVVIHTIINIIENTCMYTCLHTI